MAHENVIDYYELICKAWIVRYYPAIASRTPNRPRGPTRNDVSSGSAPGDSAADRLPRCNLRSSLSENSELACFDWPAARPRCQRVSVRMGATAAVASRCRYCVAGLFPAVVKLMAAVGAIVGWPDWLGIFFLTAIVGGLAAVALLASRSQLRRGLSNAQLLACRAPYARSACSWRRSLSFFRKQRTRDAVEPPSRRPSAFCRAENYSDLAIFGPRLHGPGHPALRSLGSAR
jgi:hypothetical protein